MFWTEELLILGVFLISLTDLVLCLLAFSDMARFPNRRPASLLKWYIVCALVPLFGPLAYFLIQEKKNV